MGSSFDGESKKFGFLLARPASEIKTSSKSSVFILGGETTIKLNRRRKNGVGGRNQEAILVAALNSNFSKDDDMTLLLLVWEPMESTEIQKLQELLLLQRRLF